MQGRTMTSLLEKEYGSRMFVSQDGTITFSIPANSLKRTVLGDSDKYRTASIMMLVAEADEVMRQMREGKENG